MDRSSKLSDAQIADIFRHHKLAHNPKVERINIGFTNEVHRVDDYIFKLYLRPDGVRNYQREARAYERLEGRALTPKLILADGSLELAPKPYIIYQRIDGDDLGAHWHQLTDLQRREVIKILCSQIELIAGLEPHPELLHSWQDHIDGAIGQRLEVIEKQQLLAAGRIENIRQFVRANIGSLEPERMAFIYWDVLLDNIIVVGAKMVGLVDLEHVDVVSVDYLLNNVNRMVKYPEFSLSPENKHYAKISDYSHLMEWFRQFYPEAFDFPKLETRLRLYELEEVLRFMPRFSNTTGLKDRLSLLLATD